MKGLHEWISAVFGHGEHSSCSRTTISSAAHHDTVVILPEALHTAGDLYQIISQTLAELHGHQRAAFILETRSRSLLQRFRGRREHRVNWLLPMDIENLIVQCSGEVITASPVVLIDGGFSALRTFVNRWFAPLPVFKSLCRYNVVIARSTAFSRNDAPSVSIIVAARNEAGNIPALIDRVPQLADVQELIFIEGGSRDETWGVIQREISSRQSSRTALRAAQQTGKGKGDAVRLGFSMATGDILIILDADLSVMPEELPRFIDLIRTGKCEFANGSRLVYPMEKEAMQFLNLIGNRLFGIAFTYLLGQSVRDTLCGTKALWRRDYDRIAARRAFFGELDPFGDFDLLFGAARLNLRIRDVPVHYKERTYGSTNISRFRHGLLLLRMTALAARRLKFVPLRIEQP